MTQSLRNRAAPCVQAEDTQKPSQSVPATASPEVKEPKVRSIDKEGEEEAPDFTKKHSVSEGKAVT